MTTHLERLVNSLGAMRAEAILISGHDHEPSDFATLLKDAGGSLETFLKTHVFPGNNGTLNHLINHLATIGVVAGDIAALHTLRTRYNSAKHDAGYLATVEDTTGALDGAAKALAGWARRGIGTCDTAVAQAYRRRVWVVGWDHFAHGDCEVHIFAPVDAEESDFPLGIDTVYVRPEAFPGVVRALGAVVQDGTGIVPKKFVDFFENEDDCAGVYAFEGEYRALLRALVGVELRLDIMGDLKREADASSMRTAIAFAAIDTIREPAAPATANELKEAILVRALTDYAAPRTARLPLRYAEEIAELLLRVPASERPAIAGPRFAHGAKFRNLRTSAIAEREGMLITPGPELVLLLGNL